MDKEQYEAERAGGTVHVTGGGGWNEGSVPRVTVLVETCLVYEASMEIQRVADWILTTSSKEWLGERKTLDDIKETKRVKMSWVIGGG